MGLFFGRVAGGTLKRTEGPLFYGPPGTGKTHTIHYLASQLPEHTTLLVTAEQVGMIGEYFRLARFLQPRDDGHRGRRSHRAGTRAYVERRTGGAATSS